MGVISDQEKLTLWHYNWVNSANPVTANSWRNMYVRLYLCAWSYNIAMLYPAPFYLQDNYYVKFISREVVGVKYSLTRYVAQ